MKMKWNKKKRTNNELKVLSKSNYYSECDSKLDSEICLLRWLWRYLVAYFEVSSGTRRQTFLCRIILVTSAEIEGGCSFVVPLFLFYKSLVINT